MNALAEFRIRVVDYPGTNFTEVRLLADDQNLVDHFASQLMGLDPEDLLIEPCQLRAENSPHFAFIGRCSCGEIGCASLKVRIEKVGESVVWSATDSASRSVQFEAGQYESEIDRALHDHTWETPDRTAARLISGVVDRALLAFRGFDFSWSSGRCRQGMMTVSLLLGPGPYQVLIHLPWSGKDIEGIVNQFKTVLSRPPETWPNVECIAQAQGLGPPPITGPGWK
jgi:hypothetical protein